ncbi:hydantoinase B/oxoprolinase family protein [Sphingomonas sp.]|uniref:hydantoinase B/oxoprolinase family protein n=1 Tax=Sphingomonas sp. TaxID=28214 RepID=UPI000DB14577|nr:hydantoinase B/oxoprolinase family protein [Sphingomonas sp.]PZU06401.1 MAG: methylhydantoinase [Sphingomonas sp.]
MSAVPPRMEVVRSYFLSAAEEVRRTLIRTAFSTAIYEVLDFGISLYDRHLDLIADAPGLAMFLGANDYAIRKGVDYIGLDNLDPGDIVVMNYPYWNSAHAADVTLFAPIFDAAQTTLIAFCCIRAHWKDLGAKDPGYVLDSTDMHQEGLIFHGTKIYRQGALNTELRELIRFNSRSPDIVLGDLEAQVAAIRIGERRLQEMHRKFGARAYDDTIARMLEHGERTTRAAIALLPQGSWEAEDIIDDDSVSDDPVPIRVRVTIEQDKVIFDFAGSSPAVRGPINIPPGLTQTICKFVLKSLTTPSIPTNAGQFRALEVRAPEGSLFSAAYPVATYTQWGTHVAVDLVYKALAKALPERLAACSGGDLFGFMMVGQKDGVRFAMGSNDAVGWGATIDHDGGNALNHISGALVRNTPIEVMEIKSAMFCEIFELRPDSGGAGEHRGGLGLSRTIRFAAPGEFLTINKRSKSAPWALQGGCSPAPNQAIYFPGTPTEVRGGTHRAAVATGDRVICHSAGGGGYGDPRRREPAKVLEDVLDGYVSVEQARLSYGVAISGNEIDWVATTMLRRPAS